MRTTVITLCVAIIVFVICSLRIPQMFMDQMSYRGKFDAFPQSVRGIAPQAVMSGYTAADFTVTVDKTGVVIPKNTPVTYVEECWHLNLGRGVVIKTNDVRVGISPSPVP